MDVMPRIVRGDCERNIVMISPNSPAEYGSLALAGFIGFAMVRRGIERVQLSLAKHRSLTGHPRMARRLAGWLPSYTYTDEQALQIDGAPQEVVTQRRLAINRLRQRFNENYARSLEASRSPLESVSDMQFVKRYRVPFQFRALIADGPHMPSFMECSSGVMLTDLDGNSFYDLTGSYGVNVFGNDFYKNCIRRAVDRVEALGPVLGSYHPVFSGNVKTLKEISGMDEVSFHMSGTEAVMQAVRLARYHTGRTKIVRFSGAYNGWWGDVQPGVGNPATETDTYTLTDMAGSTLQLLQSRSDIACVIVNPLQALHPNRSAPGDGSLLNSARSASFDKAATTAWFKELRTVCSQKGIALIFDEVFVGFRLALGGAQEYFSVQADMVTYGKTLGGGLPVGVVCGKHHWMKRYSDESPGDICFARGTFNSHPYVLGAMAEFLQALQKPETRSMLARQDEIWNTRANRLNTILKAADIPVQVANMASIWTMLYTQPARYNWLFQYYLRLEGVALSWVGTGRLIFSLNYTEEDFEQVCLRIVRAGQAMKADGWWWLEPGATNKSISRSVLKEAIRVRLGKAPVAV